MIAWKPFLLPGGIDLPDARCRPLSAAPQRQGRGDRFGSFAVVSDERVAYPSLGQHAGRELQQACTTCRPDGLRVQLPRIAHLSRGGCGPRFGGKHPVQKALVKHQAAQCGYCMSGIVMSAAALLEKSPAPSEDEIRAALDKNLCRCGSHNRVVRAILDAR